MSSIDPLTSLQVADPDQRHRNSFRLLTLLRPWVQTLRDGDVLPRHDRDPKRSPHVEDNQPSHTH